MQKFISCSSGEWKYGAERSGYEMRTCLQFLRVILFFLCMKERIWEPHFVKNIRHIHEE